MVIIREKYKSNLLSRSIFQRIAVGKKVITILLLLVTCFKLSAQKPCVTDPLYRQFDFWVGEWDVFNKEGTKTGESTISLILDSCVVFEEFVSADITLGKRYSGKSFNAYNPATKQWQQTWVDNIGEPSEYMKGKYEDKKIILKTNSFALGKDTFAVRRLTYYDIGKDKVRVQGEISKDNEKTWATEYDLEYRRRK